MEVEIKIDSNTVETLFRNHYEELNRYAFSILKKQEEAEDVVQKLFIRLWEKRNELDITDNVRAYLFRSTFNSSVNELNKIKRKGITKELTEEIAADTSDDSNNTLTMGELEHQVEKAIVLLPEKCGKVFRLSRTESRSYKEISEELNISVKTVENHMGKALKLMRKELAEYLPIVLVTILLMK